MYQDAMDTYTPASDSNLVHVDQEISFVSGLIDDFEWEGQDDHAERFRHLLNHLKMLKAEGTLYVPRF